MQEFAEYQKRSYRTMNRSGDYLQIFLWRKITGRSVSAQEDRSDGISGAAERNLGSAGRTAAGASGRNVRKYKGAVQKRTERKIRLIQIKGETDAQKKENQKTGDLMSGVLIQI